MRQGAPRFRTDRIGGALIALIGIGVLVQGWTYEVGTLTEMGPGFFPVALGAILLLTGVLIAATAVEPADQPGPARPIDLRALACIAGGVLLFIVLAQHGGLLPASFASVFVSAMADRQSTLRSSAGLAAAVSLAGVGLFHYVLGLQLPLWAPG